MVTQTFLCKFPFSVIGRALHDIVSDRTTKIIIFPNWPIQPWCSFLMKLLVITPFLLPFSKTLIQHPVKRITQLACLTSSKDQEQQIFQQRLLESYRKVDTARQRTHMTTIVKFSGFTLHAFNF